MTRWTTPLLPDPDEAREWAEEELARREYQPTEPTAFDYAARSVGDFIAYLFSGGAGPGVGAWTTAIVVAIVVILIVFAIVIWGRPRLTSRSRTTVELFGEDEARSADELRSDAKSAAAESNWAEAIILRQRAIARALIERTVVATEPGATVHRFARAASVAFPSETEALRRAADIFDDVRYLRREGTEAGYRAVADLDDRLAAQTPEFAPNESLVA